MNLMDLLTFTAVAALLTAAVLAVLLPPLWRGGSGRRASLVLGVGLPLVALSLYAAKGQPQAWAVETRQSAPDNLDAMATQMLRRLEAGRDGAAPGAGTVPGTDSGTAATPAPVASPAR